MTEVENWLTYDFAGEERTVIMDRFEEGNRTEDGLPKWKVKITIEAEKGDKA